ncbi:MULTISPECIES: hypothetical protein [unclassified Candidatus Tisiphia]|uniref:hypothetical protein n=1 Tax=unclassified Candidatus Tisiphia TaxID=2996318 RepID=UPI00312C8292
MYSDNLFVSFEVGDVLLVIERYETILEMTAIYGSNLLITWLEPHIKAFCLDSQEKYVVIVRIDFLSLLILLI